MRWMVKSFDELSTFELHELLRLRVEVFVLEQACIYPEIDGKDLLCLHLMAWEGEELAAYGRILPAGLSYDEVSFGRIAVKKAYRNEGLGRKLVQKALAEALKLSEGKSVVIGAQSYLEDFYEEFGFRRHSENYLDEGIEHLDMIY